MQFSRRRIRQLHGKLISDQDKAELWQRHLLQVKVRTSYRSSPIWLQKAYEKLAKNVPLFRKMCTCVKDYFLLARPSKLLTTC
jgi:pyruvate/oxaloacetate carboxyltransferase